MVDKNYVRYKNHYKKKTPSRADHLKEFQFQKGTSGNPKNRLSQIRKKIEAGEELTPEEVRLSNLQPAEPWAKGQSANPEGRPVGSVSLVERLKAYLRRHPEEVDAIVEQLVKQGRTGNIVATKELLDRVDGKVVERHEISGEIPVRIVFVPAKQLLARQIKEIDETNDAYDRMEREEMRQDEIESTSEPLELENLGRAAS